MHSQSLERGHRNNRHARLQTSTGNRLRRRQLVSAGPGKAHAGGCLTERTTERRIHDLTSEWGHYESNGGYRAADRVRLSRQATSQSKAWLILVAAEGEHHYFKITSGWSHQNEAPQPGETLKRRQTVQKAAPAVGVCRAWQGSWWWLLNREDDSGKLGRSSGREQNAPS